MPKKIIKKIPVKLAIILFLVALACITAICAVNIFISRYPYFTIKKVVMSGVDNSYSWIGKRFIGKNIFSLDLFSAKTEMERDSPDIECLFIQRRFPSRLFISFKKRTAVFQVKLGRFYLIDSSGAIIDKPRDIAYEGLVVVSGLESKILKPKAGKNYPLSELRFSTELIRAKNNTSGIGNYKLVKINFNAREESSFFIVENFKEDGFAVRLNSKPRAQVEVKFNFNDSPDEILKVLALVIDKGKSFESIEYVDLKNLKSPAVLEKKEKER